MFSNISLALTAICMLGLAAFLAPNVIRMNRGKVLRNIAIWLGIFAGLGLAYQFFGPGSKSPLFSDPTASQEDAPLPGAAKNNGDKGFTPPKEE